MEVTWTNCTVKLKELKPWDRNPRKTTGGQSNRINRSIKKYGIVEPVAIGPENEVYNGHQRLTLLLKTKGPDFEIDARRSSRALTEAERKELTILLHAGATGQWDWEELAGWDPGDLKEWGLDAESLQTWKDDVGNLTEILSASFDYSPNVLPEIDGKEYSEADVEKAKAALASQFGGQQVFVELTCPHCAVTYHVSAVDLEYEIRAALKAAAK